MNYLDIFQYSFMIRAFVAGIIIAVTAPLIGSFLVVKRFSLVADTLSHIALAGVAIGLLVGLQPLVTTVAVTILAALLIDRVRVSKQIPADVVLAMFLPGGLALAVILISLVNGFNTNLFSFLFGSITTVQPEEVWYIVVLGVITVITTLTFYRQLLYTSFDEESAKVGGVAVLRINMLLMVLTAVTVSLSMRIVGALLIGALMVIPVTTAMQLGRSFRKTIVLAIAFALVAVIVGLFLSYYFNLPAGGVIVLLSLTLFTLTGVVKKYT